MVATLTTDSTVPLASLQQLFEGQLTTPKKVLGPIHNHERPDEWVHVRTFLPEATTAWLQRESDPIQIPMKRIHPAGLFEGVCPANWVVTPTPFSTPPGPGGHGPHFGTASPSYRIGHALPSGETNLLMDSYAVPSLLTDFDQHLIGEGNHRRLYDVLGAHVRNVGGVTGIHFAVWAPNARGISVIGDFNRWDHRRHPMQKLEGGTGVWELFIPELQTGTLYKFRVTGADGHTTDRSDPMGFWAEVPPQTASIVTNLEQYAWSDQSWLERRQAVNPLEQPMSVYEVHLGSWQTDANSENGLLNYRELAHRLVKYCQELNYTHIELLPVS